MRAECADASYPQGGLTALGIGGGANEPVSVDVDVATSDAGTASFRLLSAMYAWFGFEEVEIPYTNASSGLPPSRIEPTAIRTK